jgi:polar amino acid transport system permease protein
LNIQFDFIAVLREWPILLRGIGWTLLLTFFGAVLGGIVGVACAWVRVYASRSSIVGRLLRTVVATYVEFIRNTPFIVQLFFIFFGLPALGIKLTPEIASVLAMVINLGAYATEIVRAGLTATPRGQIDAALALGLNRVQMFRRVILPPALAKVWPAITSQIVIVMLGSAVCGQISTEELSYAANLIQSRNFRAFEAFLIATAIYLALAIAIRQFLLWLGPRALFGKFGTVR